MQTKEGMTVERDLSYVKMSKPEGSVEPTNSSKICLRRTKNNLY